MASRRAAAGSRTAERRVAAFNALRTQLRIELRGVKPLVWRRILVLETITLAKLHSVLQWTMGWTNSHLHEYEIARRRYGVPDREWSEEIPLTDERRVRLNSFIERRVRRFTYLYDFGDSWEHVVKIEDLVAPLGRISHPSCAWREPTRVHQKTSGVRTVMPTSSPLSPIRTMTSIPTC